MKKITIADLAAMAGVSKSTVSRSLNDHPSISEETRLRIKALATEHNFSFNSGARNLSRQTNDTIALVSTDDSSLSDYVNYIISGVRQFFENHDIDVLLLHAHNGKTGESNVQRIVRSAKVAGIFVLSPDLNGDDWEVLRSSSLPVVLAHFQPPGHEHRGLKGFFVDNRSGGATATKHLLSYGCSRIITMGEDQQRYEFVQRAMGFADAMAEGGLEPHGPPLQGPCTYEYAYEAIVTRPQLIKSIDGIFVQADVMAAGVLAGIQDMGLRVPEDIAVVGFDDVNYSSYLRPRLTTVAQPGQQLVRDASTALYSLLSSPSGHGASELHGTTIYQPQLVIRDSCP